MLTGLLVKETMNVPVPEVISRSSTDNNAIGAEYILMSEVPSDLVKDVWNCMTASQHIKCIQSIGHIVQQLCAIHLPCYGSIYHATDAIKGAVCINECYVIGPLAPKHQDMRRLFQNTSVGRYETRSGPYEF